jgi:hypothetical protein
MRLATGVCVTVKKPADGPDNRITVRPEHVTGDWYIDLFALKSDNPCVHF